jgi:cobalt-zinc-cadmium efflux system membrane fusion protein
MMKLLMIAGGLVVLSSCARKEEQPVSAAAPASGEVRGPDGTVTFPADSPKLRQIKLETVRTAAVPVDVVTSPGKIEANPNLVSRVVLPLPGRIESVRVRLGDAVKRGETLLTLESPDADAAESAYRQSEASVTQAKANLNKAEADLARANDLFQHNAVAKKDQLTAENALAQSKAALEQAEAAREQTTRRLRLLGLKPGLFGQKVMVSAPISGKVLEMSVAPGEYRNDTNAPLMTIADLSTVWVSSDVAESAIRFIKTGERVDVILAAYPAETFRARVTRIADTVDPQTRTIKVRAEMDNRAGRFRPEMFGTIRHTEDVRTTAVVPPGAVVQENGKTIAFKEQSPGQFRPVEVKLGERAGDMLPVLAGLRAGDRVVVDGAMLLKAQ